MCPFLPRQSTQEDFTHGEWAEQIDSRAGILGFMSALVMSIRAGHMERTGKGEVNINN